MTRVAINGMGRIGRAALKIILDNNDLELVAINDLAKAEDVVYLLKYDSVYGRYTKTVEVTDGNISVGGKSIKFLSERDPAALPWGDLKVDIVFECTGIFTKRDALQKHIDAGAKKVILSAPAKSADVPTVVHGVNQADPSETIISTASCTTNCIAPVMEVISRHFGIKKALMNTIHAYTSTQALVDTISDDQRRGRAAALSFIPSSTGAAKATSKVLPQLEGIFDGLSVRGPVPVGSITDITMVLDRNTTVEEVNRVLREEADSDRYNGIMGFSDEQLVSSDIVMDTRGSIVDGSSTQLVDGDMLKVLSWYDNEWGYTSQMIREGVRLSKLTAEAV